MHAAERCSDDGQQAGEDEKRVTDRLRGLRLVAEEARRLQIDAVRSAE